jgi:ATP-dependent helicase/nuclease subunit B
MPTSGPRRRTSWTSWNADIRAAMPEAARPVEQIPAHPPRGGFRRECRPAHRRGLPGPPARSFLASDRPAQSGPGAGAAPGPGRGRRCALLLPRIATLAQLAAAASAGGQPDSQRQLALYRLLRERGWFADSALWEICAELIALFDELNERAIGLPRMRMNFWNARGCLRCARLAIAALRGRGGASPVAGRGVRPARPSCAPAAALAWRALAGTAATPPCSCSPRADARPVEAAFMPGLGARGMSGDGVAAATRRAASPLDAGAQPRLAARRGACRRRCCHAYRGGARRLAGQPAGRSLAADRRGQPRRGGHGGVAAEVRRWLADGRRRIALVAMPTAWPPGARALLERDGILLQDETGWKLSTTRAAATVDAFLQVSGIRRLSPRSARSGPFAARRRRR